MTTLTSYNTWEHFDDPKTLFPYCNQSLNSNERVKWLELRARARYYLSADAMISDDDALLADTFVVALRAGDPYGEGVYLDAPSDPGTYYVGVCVVTVPGESDTSNNCSSLVQATVQ